MKEKATIYDYGRLCRTVITCDNCPLCAKYNGTNLSCDDLLIRNSDKANEIILKWCKEHSVETRQSKLLKCYPYIPIVGETVDICPKRFDMNFLSSEKCDEHIGCEECKKEYWLAEVDENE